MDPLAQLNLGGLEKGRTYLVVGERGTGKTLFCMLATLKFALRNSKVVYVLTQADLSFMVAERLLASHRLPRRVLNNIIFVKLLDRSSEANLPALLEAIKPAAFVFDEVNWGYESYVADNFDLAVYRNRLLSHLLAEIHSVCRKIGCTKIYTADILSGGKVLGYNVLKYFSDIVVELKRSKHSYRVNLLSGGFKLKSYSYTIDSRGFQIGGGN